MYLHDFPYGFLRNFPEVILGQREELKALVIAGESFERAAQAGEGPVVGRSGWR